MQPDFPAAHSMDTSWFAVDKCGHVAIFNTGEAGPVPDDAPSAEHTLEGDWPFPGELDRSIQEGRIRPGIHQTEIQILTEHASTGGPERHVPLVGGFFLLGPGIKADPSRIRVPDLLNPWWYDLTPPIFGTTDGRDWVEGYMHGESWTWLHQAPHRCLGCVRRLEIDDEKRLEALRVIRYENDNYSMQPYEKTGDPWNPATLESLRALTGNLIPETVRFSEYCFREKNLVQPLQWFPCRTWGSYDSWVDEEGRLRKTDGKTPE
jgi:hypothetical protein